MADIGIDQLAIANPQVGRHIAERRAPKAREIALEQAVTGLCDTAAAHAALGEGQTAVTLLQ